MHRTAAVGDEKHPPLVVTQGHGQKAEEGVRGGDVASVEERQLECC